MNTFEYKYKAIIVSAYDADTINVDLDLGKRVWLLNESLRLNRINAPEIKGVQREKGLLAKNSMLGKIKPGDLVYVKTTLDRDDKYGRLLADIYPNGFDDYCLNDYLVDQGHAVYWNGQGSKPTP